MILKSYEAIVSYLIAVVLEGSIIPLKIEVPQLTVIVSEGSDVELRCVFIGTPTPQVTWHKDGKVADVGFPIIQAVNSRCEAILKLSSVTQSLSGHFACVGNAGDLAGTAEGNITLVVKGNLVYELNVLSQQSPLLIIKVCHMSSFFC